MWALCPCIARQIFEPWQVDILSTSWSKNQQRRYWRLRLDWWKVRTLKDEWPICVHLTVHVLANIVAEPMERVYIIKIPMISEHLQQLWSPEPTVHPLQGLHCVICLFFVLCPIPPAPVNLALMNTIGSCLCDSRLLSDWSFSDVITILAQIPFKASVDSQISLSFFRKATFTAWGRHSCIDMRAAICSGPQDNLGSKMLFKSASYFPVCL